MTKSMAILAAGALLAGASAFAATPTLEIAGGAAKTGNDATLTFKLHPNGTEVASITLQFDVQASDTANVDLAAGVKGTVPSGWDPAQVTQDQTVTDRVRYIFFTATSDGTGQTTDPLVFTMSLAQKGTGLAGAKLSLVGYNDAELTGSNVGDFDLNTIGLPAMTTGIVNGASRDLGGVMNNTVSVANGKIAAAAGTKLYLLDASSDTLADAAGWTGGKAIGGTVTGRPAFGAIGGKLAVAVGADNGDVSVFDVASGDSLGKLTGAFTGVGVAPAIDANGNIFVAGKVGSGITVSSVQVAGGNASASSPKEVTGATTATSSPAVVNGTLILGTDKGVFRASVDAAGVITPQAATGITAAINTSPVVNGNSAYVADATGKVYKVNVTNGNVDQASATLPGPVSNPFAMGNRVLFGGADGKVHSLNADTLADTPTDFASGAVSTPVDTGSAVYAAAADGTVGVAGGATVNVGGPLGSAINVLPASNQLVVNSTGGTVYAVPTR